MLLNCGVAEDSWESLGLQGEEIQPVHLKADQSYVFIGRTDVEAETLRLWPPDVKSHLIWKDPDAGKDWGREENGTTEGEMVGWHHRLNGHEFGWTPGVGDGQGGLACCGSGGRKELDMTERLNWTELNWAQPPSFLAYSKHVPVPSSVTRPCPTLCKTMDWACQAPVFMEFSRQECGGGLPFLPPRYLPNPGIKPTSPTLAGGFFITEPTGKPHNKYLNIY